MRLMAGIALSLAVRCMRVFKFLGHSSVAVEADCRGSIFEQPVLTRGMGIMAAEAFSLFHRFMHYTFELFCCRIGMARIAKLLDLLLEQTVISGDMRAVAGNTITIGCRFMFHPFLEGIAFMAFKTVNSGYFLPLAFSMAIAA